MAESTRNYTQEQSIIVEKILKHGDDYYKILEIEKSCSENEIKKAYRKLSLKVHPDKNGHPKAAESFKRVAKAFEVLGDSNKRTIYDQTGVDPDSRGGAASSGFSRGGGGGAAGSGAGHPFFQQNGFAQGAGMPQGFQFGNDDLFDILFGQGGHGGPGGATFSFGGPGGFTFRTAGGGPGAGFPFGDPFGQQQQQQQQRRANQQRQRTAPQQQDASMWGLVKQYLPMVLMLLIPLLSNMFADPVEKFNLKQTTQYSHQRLTSRFKVPYYITPKQADSLDSSKLKKLDREAENAYVGNLRDMCNREREIKEHKINQAYGWIFPDKDKLEEAQNMKLENCESLARLETLQIAPKN